MIKIICPRCKFTKEMARDSIPANAKSIRCPLCDEIFPLPNDYKDKAGFFVRMLAAIIDTLIINAFFMLLSFALDYALTIGLNYIGITDEELTADIVGGTIYFLYIFTFPTYFIYLTYKYRATIGKKILGIKVVSTGGDTLSLGQIIKRETIGKLLSGLFFGIGFLMVIFTKDRQGLHDKLAKTYVVYN